MIPLFLMLFSGVLLMYGVFCLGWGASDISDGKFSHLLIATMSGVMFVLCWVYTVHDVIDTLEADTSEETAHE